MASKTEERSTTKADKAELGRRVKKTREEKHLTLKAIEAKANISATHISEIERGKTSPTMGALIRIAGALGKDPSYFVEEEDLAEFSLLTPENRIHRELPMAGGTAEFLTASIPGGRLDVRLWRLSPGGRHRGEAHSHSGDEAAPGRAGTVRLVCDGRRTVLPTGASIPYL